MADDAFFRGRKAAAVLKHGVVSRYILPFATKVGSTSVGNRVVVLDGYAGEARYEDGTAGSPIFFANAARKLAPPRTMDLIFIEEKKARYEKLREVLAQEASDLDYEVWHGSVADHLDDVLKRAAGVPFFAFLDPCGVGLPFRDVAERILADLTTSTLQRPRYCSTSRRRPLPDRWSAERAGERSRPCGNAGPDGRGVWWSLVATVLRRRVAGASQRADRIWVRVPSSGCHRYRELGHRGAQRGASAAEVRSGLPVRHPWAYLYGNAMSTSQRDWRRAVVPPGPSSTMRTPSRRPSGKWRNSGSTRLPRTLSALCRRSQVSGSTRSTAK